MSGLVMLLPHGYDGQGPEHSSARLERYLQSCAESNIVVANVSTPANFFHLLRRQVSFDFRKPLVVMSPKQLFRHPACVSPLEEFTDGTRFQDLIADPVSEPKKIKQIIFCSGQIYYELKDVLVKNDRKDTLLVRIEQLYPFPEEGIGELISRYPKVMCSWVQEEPGNMGAASYIRQNWNFGAIRIVSRPASASPAVGYKKVHDAQQAELIGNALNP
jgi:2-oxoglutarate dehydrogenase E1 component